MVSMKKSRKLIAKPVIITVLLVILVAVFPIRRALYYSADPVGEKDCPPFTPPESDPTKPTRIRMEAPSSLPWEQKGGTVNDASCLNKTPVYGVIAVRGIEDIQTALTFARENGLPVSVAGVKHSMGGQAFARNAIVLDMTRFNKMSLDEEGKTLTVQSGATWHDIQNFLHPKFAVKAMQSTDLFTIGGSISVNAHGMDHRAGSVGRTVRSMRVMLPDGSIQTLSRTEHPDLFRRVVGGYGLFGVILEAQIEVTDNVIYRSERRIIESKDFPAVFNNEIRPDDKVGLMYGHLSTAPQSFLDEMILYTYKETGNSAGEIPPLGEVSRVKLRRLLFNLSKQGALSMRLKWFAEKYIEPKLESCLVSRNQALGEGEACLVTRNQPMHDSVRYLKNDLKGETDILQEYFIPRDRFMAFVDGMRKILRDDRANLLNASVRVVHQEDNFLNYAPTDMFAFVLYLNQTTDEEGNERMGKLTRDLIDLTSDLGGRFFLPYQLHYSGEQLQRSYPEIKDFFEDKRRYDPTIMLTNTFYEKYSPLFSR